MRKCEHCGEEIPKGKHRTKCQGCSGMLCSWCYRTHGLALDNHDGCLLALMAAKDKLAGRVVPRNYR